MASPETRSEVRAEAKWVRISPRKARLVAEHIRGRSVPEARTVLAFTQRAAAREIEKVLRSAVANAEANHGFSGDTLLVRAATVDEGPTIKRWRARARGRVARIKKRTCHITITLTPDGVQTSAPATPPSAAPAHRKAEEPVTPEAEPEAEAAVEEKPKRTRKPRAKKSEATATSTTEKPKRTPRKKSQTSSEKGEEASS
jgi:large subunit ribosomal protein L22